MAPRGCQAEFRRRVVDLVESGRPVAQVAAELPVSDQSIYAWRRQARIDAGVEPDLTTAEHAELVALRRRVRELETELAIHSRETELGTGDVDPNPSSRPSSRWPRKGSRSSGRAACRGCRCRASTAGFAARPRRGRSGTPGWAMSSARSTLCPVRPTAPTGSMPSCWGAAASPCATRPSRPSCAGRAFGACRGGPSSARSPTLRPQPISWTVTSPVLHRIGCG